MSAVASPAPKPDAAPQPARWMRWVMDAAAVFGLFEVLRIGTHVLLRALH